MNQGTRVAPIIGLLLGVFAAPGRGQTVTVKQLTFTTGCFGSEFPYLDASGDQVAFESSCSLVGNNPTSEIFLMNIDGSGLRQLTHSFPNGSRNVSINASGRKVAFTSTADFVPGQNTDANAEIFFMNSDGTGMRQLTRTTDGDALGLGNVLPRLDYAGRKLVFTSNFDLIPGGNPDRTNELYIVNTDGSNLKQLTATPFGAQSEDGHLDASGNRVLFRSNGDWLGTNPGGGQLFIMNLDGSGLMQLTNVTSGEVNYVALDASADAAAFSAVADDLNSEIYLMDIRSGKITQLTFTTGGRGCWAPSLSANGQRVAFSCDRDLVPGSNTDENRELFLAKLKR